MLKLWREDECRSAASPAPMHPPQAAPAQSRTSQRRSSGRNHDASCYRIAPVRPHRGSPAAPTQTPPPMFSTTKVNDADGVYVFRYQGHQACSSSRRWRHRHRSDRRSGRRRPPTLRKSARSPQRRSSTSSTATATSTACRGEPFKDLGATFVAHWRTGTLSVSAVACSDSNTSPSSTPKTTVTSTTTSEPLGLRYGL